MIKKTLVIGLLGLSCSFPTFSGTMGDIQPTLSPWYVGGYGGYGGIDGAYGQDGNFSQGRFALGYRATEFRLAQFGLEAGVQSGNVMRLSSDPYYNAEAGGLVAQTALKPMIDLLVTVKTSTWSKYPIYGLLKGGIAYRQLHFVDRTSSNDYLNKINGEFQGGLGYQITEHAALTAFYQGIYSKHNTNVQYDIQEDLTISNIPTQQAGFLGVEYTFLPRLFASWCTSIHYGKCYGHRINCHLGIIDVPYSIFLKLVKQMHVPC